MAASTWSKEQIQKALYANTVITKPTAWYLALHSADPTDACTVGELSGNGYIRKAFTPLIGADPFVVSNTGAVTFTASGGDWAEATHFSVWSAETGGNPLDHGPLDAARTILDGGSLIVPAEDLDIEQT